MYSARVAQVVVAALVTLSPREALAGGFELPDNGTQSLGRGAAFVAKADDPTAIYYNPAGLARQRGTKVLLDLNVHVHSFSFQRAGRFADNPADPATPWGGQPYPVSASSGEPAFAPFFAASTDFGTFDRLTVAVGVFGPPAIPNRTFPLGVGGRPASTRYDYVQSRSLIAYPSAALAYRVTPWLDLGATGHVVVAKFDETSVSFSEAVAGQCKTPEYQPCDSQSTLEASATTFAATFGALARPTENVEIGASVRNAVMLNASGTLTPQAPKIAPIQLSPGDAKLSLALPVIVRVGARWIERDGDFERYDLELDATYEAWSSTQNPDPVVTVPDLGMFKDVQSVVTHQYKDTFSVRAGGAYNIEGREGVLSLRAGAFYDSSSTDAAYTRVDFDTLAKVAGTVGLGVKHGAFALDLAYAAVASVPRTVEPGQGRVFPINGAKGGAPINGNGDPLPAVNEGAYRAFTHIFSVGATVTFDLLFGAARRVHYGNRYERGYVPPADESSDERHDRAEAEPAPPPTKRRVDEKAKTKPKPNKQEWWEELG